MNYEAGVEFVLSVIEITREQYEKHIVSCTEVVANEKLSGPQIPHLIDPSLYCQEGARTRYAVFGADKCGVSDVRKFLDMLDIDYKDLVDAIAKYPQGRDTPYSPDFQFRGYLLCSRNKDLCINVASKSSIDGYFHYMNVTAEETAALRAFQAFKTLGNHSGICWGGYW
jgi:hypothetical protein